MALFNTQHLKSVVLFERPLENNSFQPLATGFIIGIAQNTEPDLSKRIYNIFLLTNRHVFEGNDFISVRFDTNNGNVQRFPIVLKENNNIKWLAHSDPRVDLAMISIDTNILTKNNINWGFINEEIFAYPENFANIGIELGDGVFIAGFPMGISGNLQNYAIVRSGSIARLDKELLDNDKCFLIDSMIFPGNSGGPVFIKPELASLDNTKAVNQVYLIGVVSGYRPYFENLYSHQSNPPQIAGISVNNSGLATVVSMNFVKEIYESFINNSKALEVGIKGGDKIPNSKE